MYIHIIFNPYVYIEIHLFGNLPTEVSYTTNNNINSLLTFVNATGCLLLTAHKDRRRQPVAVENVRSEFMIIVCGISNLISKKISKQMNLFRHVKLKLQLIEIV